MNVLKEQPYNPLDDKELKEVEKLLKGSKLKSRVITQLKNQQNYLDLQRAHQAKLYKTHSDILRDIADEVEEMEDKLKDDNQ